VRSFGGFVLFFRFLWMQEACRKYENTTSNFLGLKYKVYIFLGALVLGESKLIKCTSELWNFFPSYLGIYFRSNVLDTYNITHSVILKLPLVSLYIYFSSMIC
jgi:hypothetical protein